MTFREKLEAISTFGCDAHGRDEQPCGCDPSVIATVSELTRLHEEEMVALDESLHSNCTLTDGHPAVATIKNLRAELRGADDEIKHQARENSQLREQLSKAKELIANIDQYRRKSNALPNSVHLMLEAFDIEEAPSPSSQREEPMLACCEEGGCGPIDARGRGGEHCGAKPEPERCQCKSYVGDDHGHYGWTDSSRCSIHPDHPKGE